MRRWKAVFQIGVGLSLLALLLFRIDTGELLAVARDCEIHFLLLGFVLVPLLVWLQSVRLHLLIGKVTGSLGETFRLVLLGFFFNQFLPSAVLGDGYKVVYLKQRTQSWKTSLSLVTLDRLTGLAVVVAGGLLYLVFPGRPSVPGFPHLAWLTPTMWLFPILLLLALLGILLRRTLLPLAARLKRPDWDRKTVVRKAAALLGLAVLALAARVYRIHFLLLGFGWNIHAWDLVYVMFLTNIAMLLPLTMGGLGIQEGVIAYSLSWFGVPLPVGAAVALLNRLAVWLVSLAGGLLFAKTRLQRATSDLLRNSAAGS